MLYHSLFIYTPTDPGERKGNLLQYSYLENSMNREAWWAIIKDILVTQFWEIMSKAVQVFVWA